MSKRKAADNGRSRRMINAVPIPCTPENRVEKTEVSSPDATRLVRTPGDYRKKAVYAPTNAKKELRRLRKELVIEVEPRLTGLYDYLQYRDEEQSLAKIKAVEKAFEARDLDLMRTYKKFLPRKAASDIDGAVSALRGIGHEEAAKIITEEHIDRFNMLYCLVGVFDASMSRKTKAAIDNLVEIAMVSFRGENEEAMVSDIIINREITDAKVIVRMVDEMASGSVTLSTGLL